MKHIIMPDHISYLGKKKAFFAMEYIENQLYFVRPNG